MQSVAVAQPTLQLISNTPGRQRWAAPAIQNRPRLAAAVQAALRHEAAITGSEVNPITGRILLRWNPEGPELAVKNVLRHALSTKPLNEDEWITLRVQHKKGAKARNLVTKLFIGGGKTPPDPE